MDQTHRQRIIPDMFKKLFTLTLASSALAATLSGAAYANSDFCGEAKNCQNIRIHNRSAALVTSVKVTQEKTDGACALDERNFSQNLNGMGGANFEGDSFLLNVNTDCKYKIKYKTTDGCSGDKVTHLSPGNFAAGKNYSELLYGCGTLKAKTGPS